MSVDWYRTQLGAPVRQAAPAPQAAPPRFVVIEGKAYPVDDGGQPAYAPAPAAPTQPWNAPVRPGDAPIGQIHVIDAVGVWKGTRESASVPAGVCPNCGDRNYMPRLQNGRMGHCFSCGNRPDTGDDRGGPTLQGRETAGSIRTGSGAIPVEQARSAGNNTDAFGRVSGRLSKDDVIGYAHG